MSRQNVPGGGTWKRIRWHVASHTRLWPLTSAHPFPIRSAPGGGLFSAGHTILNPLQSLSSELSPQSFCLLQVSVELMQRPVWKHCDSFSSFSSFNLWINNKEIYAPLSHWNWSLHSTGGSLQSVAGWQGLSCVSSTSQAEPPNWDGVWTDRVRNCGQACNSDLNSLTQNYLIMTII